MSIERIATLEAQRQADREDIAEVKDKLDDVHADVLAIKHRLDKQSGFFTGALAALTAVWSLITAAGIFLWEYFTTGGSGS